MSFNSGQLQINTVNGAITINRVIKKIIKKLCLFAKKTKVGLFQ